MQDDAKKLLEHFESNIGMAVVTGTDRDGVKYTSVTARGDIAELVEEALHAQPGFDEYDLEPRPMRDDGSAMRLSIDEAAVVVRPGQWSVQVTSSFLNRIQHEMHHDDIRRLGHLQIHAANMALQAEEGAR